LSFNIKILAMNSDRTWEYDRMNKKNTTQFEVKRGIEVLQKSQPNGVYTRGEGSVVSLSPKEKRKWL